MGSTVSFDRAANASTGTDLPPGIPPWIGRYAVRQYLGRGSFGDVYLAFDDVLRRDVAIKIPRRERITSPEDVESFIAEAQSCAARSPRSRLRLRRGSHG